MTKVYFYKVLYIEMRNDFLDGFLCLTAKKTPCYLAVRNNSIFVKEVEKRRI